MKLLKNSGTERVVDDLRQNLTPDGALDIATPALSLFAFAELREQLTKLEASRLVLPGTASGELGLLGGRADRPFRNGLQSRWLAKECAAWLDAKAEVRKAVGTISQSTLSVTDADSTPTRVIT